MLPDVSRTAPTTLLVPAHRCPRARYQAGFPQGAQAVRPAWGARPVASSCHSAWQCPEGEPLVAQAGPQPMQPERLKELRE